MNHIAKRAFIFFVLISILASSLGVIGTIPVMAQAASPLLSANSPSLSVHLNQQDTTETPTDEATEAPTPVPATDTPTVEPTFAMPTVEPPSPTATSEPVSDTPTAAPKTTEPASITPTTEAASVTPTTEAVNALSTTYTISGIVTLNSSGLKNVKVSLGSYSAKTASDGSYKISNLPHNLSGTLTPSLTGYTFDPVSLPVGPLSDNVTQNFTATINTYTVSGTVKLGSAALAGVTVSLGTYSSTPTDSEGIYSIPNVPYNTSGDLTPSLSGYVFSPAKTSVTVTKDLTGKNFAAVVAHSIAGRVTIVGNSDPNTNGLENVKVTFATSYTATTDSTGAYTINNIPSGEYGNLTAFEAGYTISPASVKISALENDLTGNDFSATALPSTYSISGRVTYSIPSDSYYGLPKSIACSGAEVTIGSYSTYTDSNGNYTIDKIAPKISGTLNVYKGNYTFNGKYINSLTKNITGMNFAADQVNFVIYGKIYSPQKNLANVRVHVTTNGITTRDGITDSSGQYFLRNMPTNNDYVLTPSLPGYTFTSRHSDYTLTTVTIDDLEDNTSQDFHGTLYYETVSGRVNGLATSIEIRDGSGKTEFISTRSDGTYTIPGLQQSTQYTLTPISPLPSTTNTNIFRFDPPSITIATVNPPVSGLVVSDQNFTAIPQVIMSGSVTVQGLGVPGVTIFAGGFSATTHSNGWYSLWVPINTALTVQAKHPYYIFADKAVDPQSQSFTQDWTSASVIVGGKISLNKAALTGVTVSASAVKGATLVSATSDTNGYSMTVLDTIMPNLADFIVTPALTGYNFVPQSQKVTPISGTVMNFTAIPHKWNVSGKVMVNLNGPGLSGVEIDALINNVPYKTFTNNSGNYAFKNIAYGSSIILSAKQYGYSLSADITLQLGDASLANQNFVATPQTGGRGINGTITLNGSNNPLANVRVSLSFKGEPLFTTKTASNGTYHFANLYPGDTSTDFQVKPELAYYDFNPAIATVDLTNVASGSSATQDFSATHVAKLNGKISGLKTGASVEFDISSTNNTPSPRTVIMDSSGRYSIPDLPTGYSYTVTPVLSGYTFNPAAYTFTLDPTITTITENFTATSQ